jgi:hypothetical protein
LAFSFGGAHKTEYKAPILTALAVTALVVVYAAAFVLDAESENE